MGVLSRIARALGGSQKRVSSPPLSERRWDGGKTNRLNSAHWSAVTGQSINQDLSSYLPVLRQRCSHEASTSAFVAGAIQLHSTHLVGARGPKLNVCSDNEAFNDALETVFQDWRRPCDGTGRLSLAGVMRLWVRSLWTQGSYLCQVVDDPAAVDKDVRVALHTLDSSRLSTPLEKLHDVNVALGVERNRLGRPVQYWVEDRVDGQVNAFVPLTWTGVDARYMLHTFTMLEPGQSQGVPWLAPSLQDMADLRDYDVSVLDAARAAADSGVVLTTNHPDADYVDIDTEMDIARRSMVTAPPGWDFNQMKPEQPTSTYDSFRKEKLRSIGWPVGIPLMVIMMDCSGYNYSSVRFDGQKYNQINDALREGMELDLDRIVRMVVREAVLQGLVPSPPKRWRCNWVWPQPPHVDPTKEANADKTRILDTRTALVADSLIQQGEQIDDFLDRAQREVAAFNARGLKHPWELGTRNSELGTDDDAKDEKSDEDEGSINDDEDKTDE